MGDYGGLDLHAVTRLFAWDWCYTFTKGGDKLHHVAKILGPDPDGLPPIGATVRTTCGMERVMRVPGIFSRMGAPRCKRCCRKLGWPEGVGSPKNDPTLRPLVKEQLR